MEVELYGSKGGEVYTLQQRSPVAAGCQRRFAEDFMEWVKQCGFRQVSTLLNLPPPPPPPPPKTQKHTHTHTHVGALTEPPFARALRHKGPSFWAPRRCLFLPALTRRSGRTSRYWGHS